MKEETIIHPIPPLYRDNSTILILGSFPQCAGGCATEARLSDTTPDRGVGRDPLVHDPGIFGREYQGRGSERPDGHSGSRADQADLCKWEDCGKDVPQIH